MSLLRLALVALFVSMVFRPWDVLAAGEAQPDSGTSTPPAAPVTTAAKSLPIIRVNGVKLHYQSLGTGEPIVFVHGGLVDYREWNAVAEQLKGKYRTITYSRRYNYPNTNPLAGANHSAIIEGEDLASLIRRLGLGPVNLVGVSYGAYTAMFVALRHPKLVRSLTIVEPPLLRWAPELPGGGALYDEFFLMWNATRDAFVRGDSEAALRRSLDWFLGPGGMDQVPPEDLAMLKSNIKEWRALTTSSDAFPKITRDEVNGIKIPVLMISGGKSYPILQLIDAEIERRLANGRRLIVPDGTHDVCSEQPVVCADAIGAFLASR
ncbi:MAG: alpha/beta hydrolase [Burkholderiaceae bacterium]